MAWPSLIEEKNHLVDIRFIYIWCRCPGPHQGRTSDPPAITGEFSLEAKKSIPGTQKVATSFRWSPPPELNPRRVGRGTKADRSTTGCWVKTSAITWLLINHKVMYFHTCLKTPGKFLNFLPERGLADELRQVVFQRRLIFFKRMWYCTTIIHDSSASLGFKTIYFHFHDVCYTKRRITLVYEKYMT